MPDLDWIDQEFIEGYRDGRDLHNPEPSGNRTEAYTHSFEIARREALKLPPQAAQISRQRGRQIEEKLRAV